MLLSPTISTTRFYLCIGNASPVAILIPDLAYPGMFRVWTGDRLSDMANLTRAMDAAFTIAQRGPPLRNANAFRWQIKPVGEAARRSVVRLTGGGGQ
jgi:hypothetical protein